MSEFRSIAALMATIPMLVACEATPRVRYDLIRSSSDRKADQFDAYYLQGTRLRVSAVQSSSQASGTQANVRGIGAKQNVLDGSDYQIAALPTEAQEIKLGLARADSFGVKTTVNIVKLANTDLVSQVGIQVTDNRVKYINEAAGVIKTIIPFIAGFTSPQGISVSTLPLEVDLTTQVTKNPNTFTLIPTPGIRIVIDRVPPDAVPIDSIVFPIETQDFLYSACRSATVTVLLSDGSSQVTLNANFKVADPHFIQRVSFPTKGSISVHAQCGVSVITDPNAGGSNGLDIANALAVQGKAIKDAIDAAKKPVK